MEISRNKRKNGETSFLSSHTPIINMKNIATAPQNKNMFDIKRLRTIMPARTPTYTATPPNTGIGRRCNLRTLGESTISCCIANLRAMGNMNADDKKAVAVTNMAMINSFIGFLFMLLPSKKIKYGYVFL